MRFSLAAMLATALFALGISACGGGDDKLSKDELARQADTICREFDKKIKAVPQPAGAANERTAADYYDQTRPIIADSIEEFETLEPADSVQRDWETFIAKQKEAARLLDEFLAQVKARDRTAQRTLAQINAAIAASSTAAKRIGADACATSSSAAS